MVYFNSHSHLLKLKIFCVFISGLLHFISGNTQWGHGKENATLLTEFTLTGLTYQPEGQIPLFFLFLVIYLLTIVGNLGLIALICNDPHLHIPMYLFLGSLAFVDAWISSTVTPKMLVNFLAKRKMISLSECITQLFSFAFSATTECFLLATMAFDRYVAICKPLLYSVIMTNRLCIQLSVLSFVGGLIHSIIHIGFLFRLTFCKSNIIHHFYCDIMPLFKISCTDPSVNVLMVFIFSGSIQVFTILTVLVSYILVLFTILKNKSIQGIRKAFSTCGATSYLSLYTMGLFSSCMCSLDLHKKMIRIWWTAYFTLSSFLS